MQAQDNAAPGRGLHARKDLALAGFVAALLRTVFMVVVGALALVVALFLVLFTLGLVAVSVLSGLLRGQRPSAQASWGRFRHSAASAVWKHYTQRAGFGRRAGAAREVPGDVQDVAFREAPSPVADEDARHIGLRR
jgi:hypothetical protein